MTYDRELMTFTGATTPDTDYTYLPTALYPRHNAPIDCQAGVEGANRRASERTSERTNERTNERANERANERTVPQARSQSPDPLLSRQINDSNRLLPTHTVLGVVYPSLRSIRPVAAHPGPASSTCIDARTNRILSQSDVQPGYPPPPLSCRATLATDLFSFFPPLPGFLKRRNTPDPRAIPPPPPPPPSKQPSLHRVPCPEPRYHRYY
ncbi:hypothetical protein CHU98_g8245 [Xylaria longipes]|nr:hypothetical protein CHU98_g8245 [Xylaria longipes]